MAPHSTMDPTLPEWLCLTAISQAIEEDPERVLAVDLEGLLRVGGFISLIQVAVHRPDGSRVVHVFDILADDSPITGQGYDAPGAPRSLRALLEDESIVKVLHCCRGDSTALWYSSGVRLLNVFDTDVGDAIVNKRHVNKQRGLQKVLHQHAGMHATLQLKDSVQHNMGALWLQRPVSAENFQYAYEDVLYLREAYIAMKTKLVEDSLLDLAFCHSRQRCPPYCWPPSHPYSESPRVAVIALHDGQSVATLSLDGDQAALPLIDCVNHKWGSAWQGGLRRRAIETWKRRFGEPIGPLKQALDSHLRSPIRIGDAYV